jgi:hypothetical protein
MKHVVIAGSLAVLAWPLLAADPAPKEEVQQAAKKLATESYRWKTTVENADGGGGGGGQFRAGPTEGVIDKDGTTTLAMTRGDNTVRAVLKGDKGAIETQDGWRTLAEAAEAGGGGGQAGRGGFMARTLRTFKAPAAEAEDLLAKAKDITKSEGGAYSGELTEQGVKELLARRGRAGGAAPPEAKGAKGSVKFWVKDGLLTKYQYQVKGTITVGQDNRELDVDRTTTVEVRDVGSAKAEVPEGARGKLT